MAEEQALDRVHRMRQTREVVTTRYIVKNSIEEVNTLPVPSGFSSLSLTEIFSM